MYDLVIFTPSEPTATTERLTITHGPATSTGQILLAGFVDDAEPLLQREMRTLDHIVVSLVTSGRGQYRDERGATEITAPSLTVVKPGHQHWYGTTPGAKWTELFAIVEGPIFDAALATIPTLRSGPRPPAPGTRPEDLAAILRPRRDSPVTPGRVWDLARWLLDALSPATDAESRRLEPAIEALTNFDQPVDLAAIAQACGLGYETFRRRFVREFGKPPLAYRNAERLRTAALLLRATDLPCIEISQRLGYSDQFHLSRRFKARYGQAPTNYRNATRGS